MLVLSSVADLNTLNQILTPILIRVQQFAHSDPDPGPTFC